MKQVLKSVIAASAFLVASQAHATDYVAGTAPAANFNIFGNIFNGPITANIASDLLGSGSFSDRFIFIIPQDGIGSGTVTTSTAAYLSVTDVDFTSVYVNGVLATLTKDPLGLVETFGISGVNIFNGATNIIEVNGIARGQGSYAGQLSFTPVAPVPEPATWAMLLVGFGAVGYAMRRRRSQQVAVSFG